MGINYGTRHRVYQGLTPTSWGGGECNRCPGSSKLYKKYDIHQRYQVLKLELTNNLLGINTEPRQHGKGSVQNAGVHTHKKLFCAPWGLTPNISQMRGFF